MKKISIKWKDYIEVNERIKEFRNNKEYEWFSLTSEIISNDDWVVIIKATIKNKDWIEVATWFAYEKDWSSFINKTSYIENCETSAWWRALWNLWIWIDTSIASFEEVANAINNQWNEPVYQQKKYDNDLPWIDDITFKKITDNKEAFIKKFWDWDNAVKEMRKNYKVARKYADQIKWLF